MRNIPEIFSHSFKVVTFLTMVLVMVCSWGCGDEDPVALDSKASTETQADITVLLRVGECKVLDAAEGDDPPLDQECLESEWDGQGSLIIRHINAALNCCPANPAIVTVVPDEGEVAGTITLDESQVGGYCDCYCLFDLEFSLSELPPGTYEITVICEDVGQPDPTINLILVLPMGVPGTDIFCIERHGYPWPPE